MLAETGSPSMSPPTPTPPSRDFVRLQTICQLDPSPAAFRPSGSLPVGRAWIRISISSPNQGQPSRVSSWAFALLSGNQRGVSIP